MGELLEKDASIATGRWTFDLTTNNRLRFVKDGSTDLNVASANNAITLNLCSIVTWDGSSTATNVRLYINGVETAYSNQINGAGFVSDATRSLLVGNQADGGRTFDGSIDDVRVYNRTLSSSDIAELYALGSGGGGGGDTTAPTRTNGSPTGQLSAGTTQTTLSLVTDENATCKYGTTANTSYASIANTFTTTGGTSHSSTVTGLTNGSSYTYYVRCSDTSNNANTSDYSISFSVAQPAGGGRHHRTLNTNQSPSYRSLGKPNQPLLDSFYRQHRGHQLQNLPLHRNLLHHHTSYHPR